MSRGLRRPMASITDEMATIPPSANAAVVQGTSVDSGVCVAAGTAGVGASRAASTCLLPADAGHRAAALASPGLAAFPDSHGRHHEAGQRVHPPPSPQAVG